MTNRKVHWDQIYTDKSAQDVSWYQREPLLSLKLIHNTGLTKVAPIIDVGGGASVLVDRLCDAGFKRLAVLDISGKALAHTKQRLGDKAERVEWFETDVTRFVSPHAFVLWHDRAVFHFLTDAEDRKKYVLALKRALPVGGHVIVAAFAIGGPTQCSGLDIVQYDTKKISEELGTAFYLVEEAAELHITPAGKEQPFSYFRFVRQEGNGGELSNHPM